MKMICKAKHSEMEQFYCVVEDEDMVKYALLDEEYENENINLPKLSSFLVEDEEGQVKGKYRHFKGNEYEVQGIAFDSNGEKYIFYKALYETEVKFYLRPFDMFFEKTDKKKYPNATQEYRFEKIN